MRILAAMCILVCCATLGAQGNIPATITITSNGAPLPAWGHLHAVGGTSVASLGLVFMVDDANGGSVSLSALVADGGGTDAGNALGLDYLEWSAPATPVAFSETPVSGTFGGGTSGSAGGSGVIYNVWLSAFDGTDTTTVGFKVWVDPPAQPPSITATAGSVALGNTAVLSVPAGTALASLALEFTVSDPAGEKVAVSSSVSNSAGTGILVSEFESVSSTTLYTLQPASGAFNQVGQSHEFRLWAQNVSGVLYLFAFTVNVTAPSAELQVQAGGSSVGSGQAAAGTNRDFGPVTLGHVSFVTLDVEISNPGMADLVLGQLSFSGDVADFVVDQSTLQATVAAGATTSFSVQFNPAVAGARTISISFSHNAASTPNPFTVEFTGLGVAPPPGPGGLSGGSGGGGSGGCSAAGGALLPLLLPLLAATRLRRRRAWARVVAA